MILAIAILGLCSGTEAFSETHLTLSFEDLPRLVQEKNQDVSSARTMVRAAEARSGHLVRSFLPTLQAGGGFESFQTGTYSPTTQPFGGAEVGINVFRGGRDYLEEGARDEEAHSAQAQSELTLSERLAEARRVYWNLVSTREVIQILRDAHKSNQKQLQAAELRIKRGLASETDRLDFQIYQSQLKEEIESFEHQVLLVEIELSAVLGLDQDSRIETSDRVEHLHDEALVAAPAQVNANPVVRALRHSSQRLEFQRSEAARWWAPSVDLFGGFHLFTLRDRDYIDLALRNDAVAGVRLSFTLFDGLQSHRQSAALSLQVDALEQQSAQSARNLAAQIRRMQEDMKHDHELIHFSEERIAQGRQYLARIVDEYTRGVKNSIDVLSASQRYVGFLRQHAERRRDYQITKTRLLAAMGK